MPPPPPPLQGCERIVDGTGRYTYLDTARLKIDQVERNNNSSYTCTLSFTLGGAERSVSESITALVSGKRGRVSFDGVTDPP